MNRAALKAKSAKRNSHLINSHMQQQKVYFSVVYEEEKMRNEIQFNSQNKNFIHTHMTSHEIMTTR
jgi:hypothetical protein